jgi:phosphocarrier protein
MSVKKVTENQMIIARDLLILNKLGMHARPASRFAKIASKYACEVSVEKDGAVVNGKSVMGLLMLAAGPGCHLKLRAEGQDAREAIRELEALINRDFDDPPG